MKTWNKLYSNKTSFFFNMGWRIKFINIRQSMLKLKHILASMIYFDSDISKSTNTLVYFDLKTFDSDMSKSTNTLVYFDLKTVIYIYVCGIYIVTKNAIISLYHIFTVFQSVPGAPKRSCSAVLNFSWRPCFLTLQFRWNTFRCV
jgi:hypothetical protein